MGHATKIHLAPDAQALVRYTYATPDFIMGSLFCDALPSEAWNNISSQNRWHGAIFSGDRFAHIYPYCRNEKPLTPTGQYRNTAP